MAKVTALVALPTTRTTPAGAALAPADLANVKLYRTLDNVTFTQVAELTGPFTSAQVSVIDSTVPDGAADVSYGYAATATDVAKGLESGRSPVVPVLVPAALGAPAAPVVVSLTLG